MSISISSVIGWSGCASTASVADVAACVVADARNFDDFLLEKDFSSSVAGSSRPEQSVAAGKSGGGVVVKKTTTVKNHGLKLFRQCHRLMLPTRRRNQPMHRLHDLHL